SLKAIPVEGHALAPRAKIGGIESMTKLVALVVVVSVFVLVPPQRTRLAAQTTHAVTPASRSWRTPPLPDGSPDLGGVWNHATLTPLERSAQFDGRRFMTEHEAAEFERTTLQRLNSDRRGLTPAQDFSRNPVNEFWFERGPLATIIARQRR